jgi:hypothetical protein
LKKAKLSRTLLTMSSHEIRILEAEAHQERHQYKTTHVDRRNQWLDSQESRMFDRGKMQIEE